MSGEIAQASKSWLSRPDGKVGTVLGIGLLAGAGIAVLYFWSLILPWLIMMAADTIHLAGLCAILAGIGVVIFDPRWRNLLFYGYKSLMRALTGMFIELDPIGILRGYIDTLKGKLEEMDTSIASLRGQRGKLQKQISENTAGFEHAMGLLAEARKQGRNDVMTLQSRQAERLQKSNVALTELKTRMDKLAMVLDKMREGSSIMIQDIQGEVDLKTKERAALLAGYNAFTKAKSVMSGSGDQREMFDQTMEHLTDDYAKKMGEVDSFMDLSKGFLDTVDLENGLAETNALASLDAWMDKSQHMIVSDPPPANGADVRLRVNALPAAPGGDEFADLLDSSAQSRPTKVEIRR